jgi:hypothetical protein
MLEILECNFIVGRVKKGTFTPVKKPTRVLIKENVEELLHEDANGNPELPVSAKPRAYYTGGDSEFRITELQTDEQGKLNSVKLGSTAHYRKKSDLWEHYLTGNYIFPRPGRIYFDGFKLFPTVKNDTGQEVNYLTIPQWILEPSRDFAPIQKPNPKWFNESLRYYLKSIASISDHSSYLRLTFSKVNFLMDDNVKITYFIRPRPVFKSQSEAIPVFGQHVYGNLEKKVIDINIFRPQVRFDLPHKEEDFYGKEFNYANMFFTTLLHETRHAFQASMQETSFYLPDGHSKKIDGDKDYLLDPHYIKQQNWSIAKDGFGYLIDDNHSELPDYKNQLIGEYFGNNFEGFKGDGSPDEGIERWVATESDARYFSQRYNETLFGR